MAYFARVFPAANPARLRDEAQEFLQSLGRQRAAQDA